MLTVLVSEARRKRWWRNFREPGAVELRLRGQSRRGTAQLVAPDSDEFRRAAEQTLRRVPGMARVFGAAFDRATGLDEPQLAQLRETIAVVRIDLELLAQARSISSSSSARPRRMKLGS